MHDFYHYVAQSPWLGGSAEYSGLNEGFPYWFNGIVPLAYGLDDARLKIQVKEAVDYVLAHQADDGWIGPENGTARNFWARYPVFLGLIGLVEADPEVYQESVLGALEKFMRLMNQMLKDDHRGYLYHEGDELSEFDFTWGRVRVADMMISLQWMYEKHPRDIGLLLLENMQFLLNGAIDWAYWFSEGVFIKQDLNTLPEDVAVSSPLFPYVHAVNAGQGLKSGAALRRFSHNDTLLESTRRGVNWTFTYHGSASGTVLGDERLAGLSPFYGSETCTVVETMYSMSYLYQALGDGSFADRAESLAYNELPVHMTPDWWARQYVTQPNQPFSQKLADKPFWNTNEWSQTYGLEVNYPCCTVNFPQGLPKFLSNSFVRVGANGLAHAFLSPAALTTTLPSGTQITVNCTTNYPFANTLIYTIAASAAFEFHLRFPTWATSSTRLSLPYQRPMSVQPDSHTGLHAIVIQPGITTLTYYIGPETILEHRANDTVAVHRGALLYALEIGSTNASTPPKDFRTNEPFSNATFPEQARDYEIANTTAWNIAIDPTTLVFHAAEGELGNPFEPGMPPSWFTVRGCEIEWGLWKGVPDAPPVGERRKCVGEAREVRLVPLGGAKVHMVDLPTIDLAG
ncbi:hypothetical protein W97_03225 [Coniosporium apollinis CBS 100218]|uniref:Non-reducing end beta-L-arabinofuranosidase-like GH127 catalytic domain-containing protein n=1 Tax=Coniosporium apollinis (strain CBS 100218) TaxID=1168221 RepID=R7YQ01_CONA1|nr:uncharacterized protein W97_03225 [Coniosporium apollinis CBS 100218]EON63995.1 hypothetical protein W97_03225 [Coniosporium apollinis CBS 100218]